MNRCYGGVDELRHLLLAQDAGQRIRLFRIGCVGNRPLAFMHGHKRKTTTPATCTPTLFSLSLRARNMPA
jgi:hypothetical protein